MEDIMDKFCGKCGTKLAEEAMFCKNCGASLNEKPKKNNLVRQ